VLIGAGWGAKIAEDFDPGMRGTAGGVLEDGFEGVEEGAGLGGGVCTVPGCGTRMSDLEPGMKGVVGGVDCDPPVGLAPDLELSEKRCWGGVSPASAEGALAFLMPSKAPARYETKAPASSSELSTVTTFRSLLLCFMATTPVQGSIPRSILSQNTRHAVSVQANLRGCYKAVTWLPWQYFVSQETCERG